MKPITELRRDLEKLPPSALVPVGWLLERLSATERPDHGADVEIDLTAEQVATLLGKQGSTVRAWCAAGSFPGAYRLNGRQWRIPRSAIAAFQQQQRERKSA